MLSAFVWRDFSIIVVPPGTPPPSRGVNVALDVKADDGSTLTSGSADADQVWVLLGDDMWSTSALEIRTPSDSSPFYRVVARNGPLWDPGLTVDVVLRLRRPDGTTVLLRLPGQTIQTLV